MVSFDTNVLVYATVSTPMSKTMRARDLVVRGMKAGENILLLQTLAEFSSVAIRKARIPVDDVRATIDAWRAVFPIQSTEDSDLSAALVAVKKHRLAFWDAMLWAFGSTGRRASFAQRRLSGRIRIGRGRVRKSFRAIER
jgi:predicted nucleic acid-binding protein